MNCSHCKSGWEILKQDKFCGICGTRVFGFKAWWSEDNPILYAQSGATSEQTWILIAENYGLLPVKFDEIIGKPRDAVVAPSDDIADIEPDKDRIRVSISIDTSLLSHKKDAHLIVRAKDRGETRNQKERLPIAIQTKPKFELVPQVKASSKETFSKIATVAIQKDEKNGTVKFDVIAQEGKFQIEKIESNADFVSNIQFDQDAWIYPGSQYEIQFDVDCTDLVIGKLRRITLSFKLKWMEQPIDKLIEIVPRILPQIKCNKSGRIEVLQGVTEVYELAIMNGGGEELLSRIAAFHKNPDTNKFLPLPQNSFELPPIKPGDIITAKLPINARNCLPGQYVIEISISSNCCQTPNFSHRLHVRVKELVKYTDYIAFDFGTTNSCMAYFDENSEVKLIQLDPQVEDGKTINEEIFPSTIIYRDTGNGKDYLVGHQAYPERTNLKHQPYYVSSVKRAIGYKWTRRFPIGSNGQLESLSPKEVVLDMASAFMKKAEQVIEKKVTRCVVTHPTMFSLRQREELRWVFNQWLSSKQKSAVDEDGAIIFVDEATAASLDYIYERKREHENQDETYNVLVYDFGGGTIDMALSNVVVEGSKLTIDPLTVDGTLSFGGDDVTELIVEWIVDELENRLREQLGKDAEVHIKRRVPDVPNPDLTRAIQDNNLELHRVANRIKLDLTDLDKVQLTPSKLKYVVGDSQYPKEISSVLKDWSVTITRKEFNRLIRPELEKTLGKIDGMIKKDTNNAVPGVVILAGQSSQIPLVYELLDEHFKQNYPEHDVEISIERNSKALKARVVRGAAQYADILSSPMVGEEDPEVVDFTKKTHARFGLRVPKDRQGRFEEFIKKGTPINGPISETKRLNLKRMTRFKVYEHFGRSDKIDDEAELFGEYTRTFPPEVQKADLRQVPVKMTYTVDESIELSANIGEEKYILFKGKRQKPPFWIDERD